MKRKLMFIIGLSMLLLCACAESGDNVATNESPLENQTEQELMDSGQKIELKDEILNAELGSGLIQIGSELVRFPIMVSELTEQLMLHIDRLGLG